MLMELIIETSNNNITIADDKGYIVYSNPAHWSIYGITAQQYEGKTVYQLQDEGILTPSITVMVLKERKKMEIMQYTKTGKIIMTTGYPLFDDNGNLLFVLSYSQDQTEISKLQDKYEHLERKLKGFQTEVEELRGKEGILYRNKEMEQVVKTIQRVAETDATVLLLGESGVGKSLFARQLHNQSPRHKELFIEVNCSTIPESLFESEMFGYETGTFTGAQRQGKQGLIEQAHNGTLFLDEIGELPLAVQVKLLKVLQEKKFMRLGGSRERHIDFRLVSATNQNLEEMVKDGTFRLDLYYRLNVIPLSIPPLRKRKEDIAYLIHHYLEQINHKYSTKKKLHPSTYDLLIQYSWPGNVRELENIIERIVLTTEENIIYPGSLPSLMIGEHEKEEHRSVLMMDKAIEEESDLKTALEKVEKYMLLKAAKECKSSYEMAKLLGISQPSVIRKLKKYKSEL